MIEKWIIACVVLLFAGLFSYRFAWWRKHVALNRPRILMYHMVRSHRKGSSHNKLRVRPPEFEKQIAWLTKEGWRFRRMSELKSMGGDSVKNVFVTFDDGYVDNLEEALPVLKKYKACATLYLVAKRDICLDWPAQRNPDKAGSDLSTEPRLSDSQVCQLIESGCFEIASHTVTHADLTQLSDIEVDRQLMDSRLILKDKFQIDSSSFCYPFGRYLPGHPEVVRRCGYASAVTTRQGIANLETDSPVELPRIKVSGKEGMFAFRLRMRTGFRGFKK